MSRLIQVLICVGLGVVPALVVADEPCSLWLDNDSSQAAHFDVDGRYSCDAPAGQVCEFLPDCSTPRGAVAHCIVTPLSSGEHTVTVQAGAHRVTMQIPLRYYPAESDPDMGDSPAEYSRHCALKDVATGVALQCLD